MPNAVFFDFFIHGIRGKVCTVWPSDCAMVDIGLVEKGGVAEGFENATKLGGVKLYFPFESILEHDF
jgi:hypothetical protein